MVSTTRLARSLEIEPAELFRRLDEMGLIEREEKKWILSDAGRKAGGSIQQAEKGEFIVWPEDFNLSRYEKKLHKSLISATDIGEHFQTSAQKINKTLSSLGWVEQQRQGWCLTKLGKSQGGFEFEASTGKKYVKWSLTILEDKGLNDWFDAPQESIPEPSNDNGNEPEPPDREKLNARYPPKYSTQDGHVVRSLSEKNIDDYLFRENIVHAYERPVNTKHGDLISDFYIPAGARQGSHAVYIEFWGMKGNESYERRKQEKLAIYEKAGLLDKLIQLEPEHLSDLESHLGRFLLKVADLSVA